MLINGYRVALLACRVQRHVAGPLLLVPAVQPP
jgi:hypothetical protein